jgi:hypothetical protein
VDSCYDREVGYELNDELVANVEKTLNLSYIRSLIWMLRRDSGSGESICQRMNVRTLMIAAGRQDIVDGLSESSEWLGKGDPRQQSSPCKYCDPCLELSSHQGRPVRRRCEGFP